MNSLEHEFSKNLCELNRCKKMYNVVSMLYLIPFTAYALTNAYMWVLSLFLKIDYLVDGVIFKALVLAAGYYMGLYRRNNHFALLAPIVMGTNLLIFDTDMNFLLGIMVFLFSVSTLLINKKYAFLEKQTGFPYFNTRIELENIDRVQRNIKDPYQVELEKRKKTESSEMNVIPDLSQEQIQKKEENRNSYMDEI